MRQGCPLAPLLYATFTAWFHHRLSTLTNAEWAAKLVTLFADDSPRSRLCAENFPALGCWSIRISRTVIGLKGSVAKRWLHARCQRVGTRILVNFGSPLSSLWVLRTLMWFIWVSLPPMETTKPKPSNTASKLEHKIVSVWQSCCTPMCCRSGWIRLYQACTRSTVMYGLHAVGVTESVLQKLESGAGAPRLAKSPASHT